MNTMIEMYDRIMSVVEEVTGISKDKILTSNCEECVDARHILVYILGNRSFSDNKIAELTGLTRPGVCIIRKIGELPLTRLNMIWSNNKVKLEMLKGLRTSSKMSLKMSCLAIANGDLKKATEMYDFFAKDMQLPDTDPVVPTTFQQIKETAGTILGWFNEHQDDVTRTFNFIQSIRKGEPIINTPTTPPVDIPPLPTE